MDYNYSNLPQCEQVPHHPATTRKPGWAGRYRVPATAAVVLVLIAAAGFVLGATMARMAHASEARIDDCGETPAEARAKGCRYDPMIQMWVPVACYDQEHSERYLSTYKWKWYYDLDAKHEMPDETMRLGEHQVAFMVDDYHRRHCAYVWEVSARALEQQRSLLDEWISSKHVHHCNGLLLSPPWNSTKHPLAVEARTRYGRCAPYHVWVDGMPK